MSIFGTLHNLRIHFLNEKIRCKYFRYKRSPKETKMVPWILSPATDFIRKELYHLRSRSATLLALLQNWAISQPTDRRETVIEYWKDHFRQFTVSTLTFKTTYYFYSWIRLFRQKVQSNQENASYVKHKKPTKLHRPFLEIPQRLI